MTISRLSRAGALSGILAIAALLASCGDHASIAAPQPDARLYRGHSLLGISLLGCSPLPYDSVTQPVGPGGGTISVGAYSLTIPAGALDDTVAITAVAPSGNVNLVQFQPEGLRFNVQAQLTMSYANCSLLGSLLPRSIAHTDDNRNILYLIPSLDNIFAHTVTGQIGHFSDYAVAW